MTIYVTALGLQIHRVELAREVLGGLIRSYTEYRTDTDTNLRSLKEQLHISALLQTVDALNKSYL